MCCLTNLVPSRAGQYLPKSGYPQYVNCISWYDNMKPIYLHYSATDITNALSGYIKTAFLPMLQQPLEAVLAPGNSRCSNDQAAGCSQQAIFISDSNSALSVMWHLHSDFCHHYTDGKWICQTQIHPLFEQPLFDFLTNGYIIGRLQ